jgi:DNA-binding MarR family transcriptional regulator
METAAFLLSQLGAHAGTLFLARAAELDLTGPQIGVLRAIADEPGASQQALAQRLDILPSRVVALVDDLEQRGLVRRERHPSDRRSHALRMTETGARLREQLRVIGNEHNERLLADLTDDERATLTRLLAKVAATQGLRPGVHPGFRHLAGR